MKGPLACHLENLIQICMAVKRTCFKLTQEIRGAKGAKIPSKNFQSLAICLFEWLLQVCKM